MIRGDNSLKRTLKKKRSTTLQCPAKPAISKAICVKVEKSTFAADWLKALQDPKFHDVTFVVEGRKQVHAHSIILCAASPFFERVLAITSKMAMSEQQDDYSGTDYKANELAGNTNVAGVCDIQGTKTVFGRHTTINLNPEIKADTFSRFLDFLYTGKPRTDAGLGEEDLQDLQCLSALFEVPYFANTYTYTYSITGGQDGSLSNTHNAAFFNHQRVSRLKSLYFNRSHGADVEFLVEGRIVYSHKAVLSARCEVMAAMFSGRFLEGKSGTTEVCVPGASYENFCAFLEYLYTDHAPLKQLTDVIGLLALADEKNQPRLLNLCELYICRVVEKTFQPDGDEKDVDVIGLLNTAHTLNAKQLVSWCLHFISINYEVFSNRKDFLSLSDADRAHVEENRWPPLSYLESLQDYKKQSAAKKRERKDSCAIT